MRTDSEAMSLAEGREMQLYLIRPSHEKKITGSQGDNLAGEESTNEGC